jgi:transcriptional regulator with XRE-family HTH domain
MLNDSFGKSVMNTASTAQRPSPKLGEQLRAMRDAHGLSLRAVETATGISNAYLSQIETGKVERPAPNILYKLAELYGTSYDGLMELAGHLTRRDPAEPRPRTLSQAALSAMSELTPEEEAEIMKYISFIRARRPK